MARHRVDPKSILALLFLLALVLPVGACRRQVRDSSPTTSSDAKAESPASAAARQDDELQPERLLTYEESNGRILYLKYCAVCHGATGAGDGFNAYNLRPTEPRNFTDRQIMSRLTDDQLFSAISRGGASRGISSLMPAWGDTFNGRQIRYIVRYLRTFVSQESMPKSP